MIARDKEVVKSVLLLTGSVEGIKNQVGLRRGWSRTVHVPAPLYRMYSWLAGAVSAHHKHST